MKKLVFFVIGVVVLVAGYYFFPEKSLAHNVKIDRLVVKKADRKMEAYYKGELLKTYTISLGFNPIGHKEYEGDGKTPEGVYTINDRNPKSGYYLNLGVSYPNEKDRQHASSLGKSPGGDIKIHGLRNGNAGYIGKFHRFKDWTAGCIAVTNDEVQELYDAVILGSEIEIKP